MKTIIKEVEALDGKPLISICVKNKEILLNEDELRDLIDSIDLFRSGGIKILGFSTYFKTNDNHNEYIDIHIKEKGEEYHEIFALKHREERQEYLDYMKQNGLLNEGEYLKCLLTE